MTNQGASPKSCLTRWVEWTSWWNGHLGGMGILPVSISGQQPNTGGALWGGLSQGWLRGEK
ncbi:hypothetical protein BJP36_42075 [Moorena producens JHB]|uniref:Uncharacterized protein n=1 Tax=Moorena producens (strain JHB) TaxID=1454205 RepID=A0A9Q9SSP2_MOOP1|nr:hypothetical protein [Moorena producens]WAN68949.1 hypothetical protein BJP36_42075 [Moorena producens JHB]